jgi:hypothetical protein
MLPPELTAAKREKARQAFAFFEKRLVGDPELREAMESIFRWMFGKVEADKSSRISERLQQPSDIAWSNHAYDEGLCAGWSEARNVLLDPAERRRELDRIDQIEKEQSEDE